MWLMLLVHSGETLKSFYIKTADNKSGEEDVLTLEIIYIESKKL
jgi:hypothetical protein